MPSAKTGLAAATVACAVAMGCAPESPETAAARKAHPHAAELWGDKCGSCHVPVEPGTRSREALETALRRHRTRAKLTEGDWAELVDFLAPAAPLGPKATSASADAGTTRR
jgi:hypothetical protein